MVDDGDDDDDDEVMMVTIRWRRITRACAHMSVPKKVHEPGFGCARTRRQLLLGRPCAVQGALPQHGQPAGKVAPPVHGHHQPVIR